MLDVEQKRILQQRAGLNFGKIPPQVIQMEESVLGSIISSSEYLVDVEEILRPDHFYHEAHKKIFNAILVLSANNSPIDLMTVTNQLRKSGELEMVGGNYYVANLSNNGVKGKVEYHARIIIEKFLLREIIRKSSETMHSAYDDTMDVHDLIEKHDTDMFSITSETHSKQGESIGALMMKSLDKLDEPSVEGLTGVGSGFTDLDKITNGWQPSDLIIIAARPAMGKTAFVLKCARNASVKFKKPGIFFSLEMSSPQLTDRMLSDETGILLDRILKKTVHDNEKLAMRAKVIDIENCPLIIDDTPSLSIFEFRAKAKRLKKTMDIGFIIVDYLQLMDGDANSKVSNRDNEIGKISRGLKKVAKELNIPVLALSQLSRAVESRPGLNKRPMLSDLRESGNIEQDADMVLFLHRPEYYGVTSDSYGRSTVGLCEVIIAKNRNGVCDTIKLDFNGAYMRFKDWERKKKKGEPEETLTEAIQAEIFDKNMPLIVPNHESHEPEDDDSPF